MRPHVFNQFHLDFTHFRYLLVISAFSGAFTVFGFAPFYFYLIPFITLTVLCYLLIQAKSSIEALWLGLCFGLGMYSAGLSWMVVTLHDFAEMPIWLACFATAILCLYMASFTAFATWIVVYLKSLWFLPFAWAFSEWIRGWGATGFPWLGIGYSQVPSSIFSAFLPVTGVYGLSIVVVGLVVSFFYMVHLPQSRWLCAICLIGLSGITFGLQNVSWTVKHGEPVKVALLQGNIVQETKWSVEQSKRIILNYLDLIEHADANVIVLPETAFPIYLSQAMGKTREKLLSLAQHKQANILIGMLDWQDGSMGWQKFNAVVNYGLSGLQVQHKAHLVPFGEFVPIRQVFSPLYGQWFHMPHSDFAVGKQQLFTIGQSKVTISICYDDMFGHDMAKHIRQAEYIVSTSNGAWFGNSIGVEQYLQFSQARAIENQKMLIRASNNGVTAFIDMNGEVISRASKNERTVHEGYVQRYQGITLYNRVGDMIFLCLELIGLIILFSGLLLCQKKFT